MTVASQLISEVKAIGADTTEAQLLAVGQASDAAAVSMASMGDVMKAAGLEFFDFDAASGEFVSNMAEATPVTDAETAAVDALKASVASIIPTVGQLNAQFATMRAEFATNSAAIDAEQASMMRVAEANQAAAATADEASISFEGLGAALASIASFLGTVALVGGIVATILGGLAVKAASDLQQRLVQTAAALKSTHDASGETVASILKLADAFSLVTEFSKDAILQVENILLTFPSISKKIFHETTQAVLDLSQAMHQNLKQSAIEVGKALDDPARGLTNLRRIGVQFTDAQAAVIKALVATGHSAEAQALILKELEREFGGSAKAAAQTFGGQLALLWHALQDVADIIGKILLPYLTQFVQWLTPLITKFADWETHTHGIEKAMAQAGGVINQVVGFVKGLYQQFLTFLPILNQIAQFLISTFAPVWQQLQVSFRDLQPTIKQLLPYLIQIGQVIAGVLVVALVLAVGILAGFIRALAEALKGVIIFVTGVIQFVTGLFQVFMGFWNLIQDLFHGRWNKLWGDAQTIFQGFVNIVQGLLNIVVGLFSAVYGAISGFTETFVKTIVSLFRGLANTLVGHSIIPEMIAAMVAVFATLPGRVLSAIASLAGALAGFFNGLAAQALSWGLHIIQNLAAGILAGLSAAIAAAQAIANAVAAILGHSVPKEGPLMHDDTWGAHLVDNFVRGILAGTPRVQAAFAQMLSGAGVSGGGLNLGISGSFSGPSGIASSFGGAPVIHVHVHNDHPAPVYLDGRQITQAIGPHLANEMWRQNGWRHPT